MEDAHVKVRERVSGRPFYSCLIHSSSGSFPTRSPFFHGSRFRLWKAGEIDEYLGWLVHP